MSSSGRIRSTLPALLIGMMAAASLPGCAGHDAPRPPATEPSVATAPVTVTLTAAPTDSSGLPSAAIGRALISALSDQGQAVVGGDSAATPLAGPRYSVVYDVETVKSRPPRSGMWMGAVLNRNRGPVLKLHVVDLWTGEVVEVPESIVDTTNLTASVQRSAAALGGVLQRRPWSAILMNRTDEEIVLDGSGLGAPALGALVDLFARGRLVVNVATGRPSGFAAELVARARITRIEGGRAWARIESGQDRVRVGLSAMVRKTR